MSAWQVKKTGSACNVLEPSVLWKQYNSIASSTERSGNHFLLKRRAGGAIGRHVPAPVHGHSNVWTSP